MKYDTSKTGWETILKGYQGALLEKFISIVDDEKNEMNSRKAHEYLLTKTEHHVSRASVIFTCKDMENMGLLTSRTETGKGGHHNIWSLSFKNREAIENYLISNLLQRIKDVWPRAFREVLNVVG